MTTTGPLLSNLRGMRYGEVLLAYLDGEQRVEVFNSFPMNQCPDELWRALSPEILAKENNATFAILNGPRYWLMDGIGKVPTVEPVIRDFGGIEMRRVATIELDGDVVRMPYRERHVNRGAVWYFNAGSRIHELSSPDARTYVMQAYCTGVDESLSEASLVELGDRLDLPVGWSYDTRVLSADLVVDTTAHVATVLQDELENTYTLIGTA
ncbi:MAG: hypothetical protein WAN30_05300 [Acidimicrobiales bacterium]